MEERDSPRRLPNSEEILQLIAKPPQRIATRDRQIEKLRGKISRSEQHLARTRCPATRQLTDACIRRYKLQLAGLESAQRQDLENHRLAYESFVQMQQRISLVGQQVMARSKMI